METAAFLGVLGLGYILSPDSKKKNNKEGFKTLDVNYEQVGANPEKLIKKQKMSVLKPNSASKELDILYNFPSDKSIPSEPNPGPTGSFYGFPSLNLKTRHTTQT